jgi:sec-independent protein translocase protein TatA
MNTIPMLFYGLGMPELLIVLVILLILFGGSRLPSLAKGLGESIRSFKQGVSDEPEEKKDNTKPA